MDMCRTIVALFAGGMMTTFLILRWKSIRQFTWWLRLSGSLLCAMVLFSTGIRAFVYQAGVEPAPVWYAPINDVLMTALSLSVIFLTANSSRKATRPSL